MGQLITTALLWFSAIGCGMLAGLYYAFSTSIMTGLGRVDQTVGITTMNSINAVIVRSSFMPLFLGTTLAAAAIAVLALFRWGEPGAIAMLAGGLVHVIGMFVVTMALNVPLNNALAAVVDPGSAEAADVWTRYLKDWTYWNHVRTVSSTAALILFVIALTAD